MWFIGVEVEQETSAPPPEKNPGSAPEWGEVGGGAVFSGPTSASLPLRRSLRASSCHSARDAFTEVRLKSFHQSGGKSATLHPIFPSPKSQRQIPVF